MFLLFKARAFACPLLALLIVFLSWKLHFLYTTNDPADLLPLYLPLVTYISPVIQYSPSVFAPSVFAPSVIAPPHQLLNCPLVSGGVARVNIWGYGDGP